MDRGNPEILGHTNGFLGQTKSNVSRILRLVGDELYKVGPLPVISKVITPLAVVITRVAHL